MQTATPNLFTRSDTFFGVCEGLGEDLRIPANLIRLALAGLLFWNPVLAIGGYLAVGLVIAAARFLFPDPLPAPASVDDAAGQPTEQAEPEPMPLAA